MAATGSITARNRAAWNAIAPDRPPRSPEYFAGGGHTLDEAEAAVLGDLTGTRALHLQCANGNETLSLAVLGAEAVGVDISEVAIDIARTSAGAAGLNCRFHAADVYDLPAALGEFDLVYASSGVVCWLPDLPAWAAVVAAHLREGGRFVLYEHHPLWEVLDTAGGLRVDGDYFGSRRDGTAAAADRRNAIGTTADSDFVTFVWPVADVVTALLGAGLRLTVLSEQSAPGMYAGLGEAAGWLPATYLIEARKPARD